MKEQKNRAPCCLCPDPASGPPLHPSVLSTLLGNVRGETDSFAERALRSKVVDIHGAGSPFTLIPETSEQTEMLSVNPKAEPRHVA